MLGRVPAPVTLYRITKYRKWIDGLGSIIPDI